MMPHLAAKPRGISWLAIFALTLVFLVRGVILLCVLPPFEGWDEFEHVGYIDHLAQYATDPVYGETLIDPAFARVVARFPQPQGDALRVLGPYGAVGYQDYWKTGSTTPVEGANPIALYEAQQPPFYYRLMVPVYRLCGGRGNLGLAVAVLRGINLGFAALAMACMLWWMRRSLTPPAGLLAGLCLCLQPLILQDLVRVANDPLAFLLGTVVICTGLSLRRPRFWGRCLLIAAALPLGTLAKTIDLTFLPVVFGALLLCAWRREVTWKQAAGGAAIIVAVFLALTGPYFVFNLRHFGVLTPMQEAVVNHRAQRGLLEVIGAFPMSRWPSWIWKWWVEDALWIGGWSSLFLSTGIAHVHVWVIGTLLMAVPAALALKYARRRWPMELRHVAMILLVLGCVNAGLLYHACSSYSAWNGMIATPSWYTVIGQPWLLILLVTAMAALIPRSSLAAAAVAILPALYLTADASGLVYRMIPYYGQAKISWESLRRLATLRPPWLGTLVMLGAQVALTGLIMGLIGMIIVQVRRPASE